MPVTTVAVFNDAGLMLQAVEQNLGLAISRELLAADALRDGRLARLSPLSITHETAMPYHLVFPPACASGRRSSRCGNGCATSSSCRARRCAPRRCRMQRAGRHPTHAMPSRAGACDNGQVAATAPKECKCPRR